MYLCVCGFNSSYYVANCPSCNGPVPKARTQKGKGIFILKTLFPSTTLASVMVVQSQDQLKGFYGHQLPMFARPAPSKPRHGYIDSRVVKTVSEVSDLLKQVLADDPKGELLLCPFIDANCSAIWTPGSITIGAGNDGATAGKNCSIVPLAGFNPIKGSALKDAGIADSMWPYIEMVFGKLPDDYQYDTAPTLVQLREGPNVGSAIGNYIPKTTTVASIIKADPKKFTDLGWEQAILETAGKEGVVVWHPEGSITDHFSIHAFFAKIPVVFDTERPKVGDTLEKTSNATIGPDPTAMLKGFIAGSKIPMTAGQGGTYLNSALLALHNSAAMVGDGSKWLGYAAAVFLRYGMAALNGEARHFSDEDGKPGRDTIYKVSLEKSLTYHKARLNRVINVFRYGKWRSIGFGGPKWACCGAATCDVFNAVFELANNLTEENAGKVVQAMNLMVNQAHNSGWWFNKFVGQNSFQLAQKGDINFAAGTVPAFYRTGKLYKAISDSDLKLETKRIVSWGRTLLSPPKATSAKILYHPSVNAMEVSISSKLLGAKFKPLRAAVTKLSVDEIKLLKKCLYLVEGDDGYRLELRKDDPVVIWQDDSLREMSVKQSKTVFK